MSPLGSGTPLLRVDVHVHPTRFTRLGWEFARKNGIEFSPTGLLREMDRFGVGWGVFLAPRLAPSLEAGLEEANRVARESEGRFLPTGTVDPTRGPDEIERALQLWSESPIPLRAIKLYPGYRPFHAADPRLEPVYAWAERTRTPVFVHQGDTSDPDGLIRYAQPFYLDEVAVRWRSVRFVVCHLANPWMEEAATVVYKNPNVWADTSGLLNPFALRYADQIARMRTRLRHALLAVGGAAKLLFGSDWPISSLADALGLVEGIGAPPEEIERILGGNAREFFGLRDLPPARRPDPIEPGPKQVNP
jgi:predicted TIM-barrel fold metal-dependent hydrolase